MISKNLQNLNNFAYDRINKNYDFFIVITGNEGTGKSRGLMLNIVHDWYNRVLNRKPAWLPFVTDFAKYPDLLEKSEKFDMVALDEAGDSLDNTQTGTKLKNMVYRSYTIIREKGIYSVVVMPSIFDLYSKFVRRRVNVLLHADHRVDNYCRNCKLFFAKDSCPACGNTKYIPGYVYYVGYRRKALQALIDANQDQRIKMMDVVEPSFTGKVHEYKGEWAEQYSKEKRTKTEETIAALKEDINNMLGKGKVEKVRCPNCGSTDTRFKSRENIHSCRRCPATWPKQWGGI